MLRTSRLLAGIVGESAAIWAAPTDARSAQYGSLGATTCRRRNKRRLYSRAPGPAPGAIAIWPGPSVGTLALPNLNRYTVPVPVTTTLTPSMIASSLGPGGCCAEVDGGTAREGNAYVRRV